MLIELLTPIMIATSPLRIDVEQPNYDHQLQKNISVAYQRITYNGTQTFDWNGRPNDSDND